MSEYEKLVDKLNRIGYTSIREWMNALAAKHSLDVDFIRKGFAVGDDVEDFEKWVVNLKGE